MKVLRKVLNWCALILFFGGIGYIFFSYFSNRSFITYITKMISDANFGKTIKHMLYGLIAAILALVLYYISFKLNGKIKIKERIEKEKQLAEAAKIKEEAEALKAEAEQAKMEALEAKAQAEASTESITRELPETQQEEVKTEQ